MLKTNRVELSELPGWARQVEERIRKLDRRHDERTAISGEGIGVFAEGEGGAKIARVEFLDCCGTGLGVRCGIEIKVGSHFTLRPEKGLVSPHAGTVARCERDGEMYRIGLRILGAKAA